MDIFELAKARILAGKGGNTPGGGGGGGGSTASKKDVNFYDYDGTLLHSYTVAEAQALSELPPLPTQKGLVCQGWNWTLEDIKSYDCGIDVGASYITDDGKTRLYITITARYGMEVPLYFSQTADSGAIVDWGDGSATETVSGTGVKNLTHKYTSAGDYVITLDVVSGTISLGNNKTYGVLGVFESAQTNMLKKVEFGNSADVRTYAFYACYSLKSITVPHGTSALSSWNLAGTKIPCYVIGNGATYVPQSAFQGSAIKIVSIPNTVTCFGQDAFAGCSALSRILVPKGWASTAQNIFSGCVGLSNPIVIPKGNTYHVYPNEFYNCYSLPSVELLNSPGSIAHYAFCKCQSLTSMKVPSSVNQIDTSAFASCTSMKFYDFTSHTTVPTLSSTTAFANIPTDCEIRVPAALYDEWIAATNWSTYASQIVAV